MKQEGQPITRRAMTHVLAFSRLRRKSHTCTSTHEAALFMRLARKHERFVHVLMDKRKESSRG
jgi:hypothetical protein